jgi:hypothetical protein
MGELLLWTKSSSLDPVHELEVGTATGTEALRSGSR